MPFAGYVVSTALFGAHGALGGKIFKLFFAKLKQNEKFLCI